MYLHILFIRHRRYNLYLRFIFRIRWNERTIEIRPVPIYAISTFIPPFISAPFSFFSFYSFFFFLPLFLPTSDERLCRSLLYRLIWLFAKEIRADRRRAVYDFKRRERDRYGATKIELSARRDIPAMRDATVDVIKSRWKVSPRTPHDLVPCEALKAFYGLPRNVNFCIMKASHVLCGWTQGAGSKLGTRLWAQIMKSLGAIFINR